MKTWSYGIGGGERGGRVILWERPWWIEAIEGLACAVSPAWLERFDLPSWPRRKWSKWDDEESGSTPREWWGTVAGFLYSQVTSPLIQWTHAHPRNKRTEIELGYDKVKELFYAADPAFFDDHEGSD